MLFSPYINHDRRNANQYPARHLQQKTRDTRDLRVINNTVTIAWKNCDNEGMFTLIWSNDFSCLFTYAPNILLMNITNGVTSKYVSP